MSKWNVAGPKLREIPLSSILSLSQFHIASRRLERNESLQKVNEYFLREW